MTLSSGALGAPTQHTNAISTYNDHIERLKNATKFTATQLTTTRLASGTEKPKNRMPPTANAIEIST